jgi:hypothetical protein
MPKLSDSQLVVLTAACRREDGCVFPVTSKLKGNAAGNVLKSLLTRGLLEEVHAERDDTVWRHDEDKGSLTLRATPAAYVALGIEATVEGTRDDAPQAATRAVKGRAGDQGRSKAGKGAVKPARATGGKGSGSPSAPVRTGTKQEKLIAMLRTRDGATVEEIAKAFDWQSHTVRGAIAGALKKKLGLTVNSEKVEGRGRVYRIAN